MTVGHGAVLHSCKIGDGSLIGMGAVVAVLCLSILYKVLKIDKVEEGRLKTSASKRSCVLNTKEDSHK